MVKMMTRIEQVLRQCLVNNLTLCVKCTMCDSWKELEVECQAKA